MCLEKLALMVGQCDCLYVTLEFVIKSRALYFLNALVYSLNALAQLTHCAVYVLH